MTTREPPPICPEEVAAVVDRRVPVVLQHLQENPLAFQTEAMHLTSPTVLLSQYADPHSQYHGDTELLAAAWREIDHVLGQRQPQFSAYDTAFQMWALFDCYRAAESVLPASQLARLRELFRPLGELLLAKRWDFDSDSKINVALLQAVGLGVAGWALDDERMRGESRARAEAILAERCDENGVPSEVSLTYSPQMVRWAAQACEVEHRPQLLRLIAGVSRILPMFIYEPTLELMGPDCRELWKAVCRYTMDQWVVGLRVAAALLSDGSSEWLARALFRKWERDEEVRSETYTPRGPRYIGCKRHEVGWAFEMDAVQYAIGTAEALCAVKRWLRQEVAASRPAVPYEYRSSRLFIRRYESGSDVAAVGNLVSPLSYFTPSVALQGLELWTDDEFFWWDFMEFLPTMVSDDVLACRQAPYSAATRKKRGIPASDRIVFGAAKDGDQLLGVLSINCRQELVPGIVKWAGLLLLSHRDGELFFGRGESIERGRVLDEQTDCDWFLYPCGEGRRFGFGIIELKTTGRSDRLSNYSGDWCVLGLSESAQPLQGLRAFAVLAIGPWEGSPESYAKWLKEWHAEASRDRCILTAPDGRIIELPFPALA
ncbi:MAG: hypothetical protein JSV65_18975 [Armatimonadota bacterium]|nr:MAG: hypothetical protein JSV65_18975 [Armatimonadota bacterium]